MHSFMELDRIIRERQFTEFSLTYKNRMWDITATGTQYVTPVTAQGKELIHCVQNFVRAIVHSHTSTLPAIAAQPSLSPQVACGFNGCTFPPNHLDDHSWYVPVTRIPPEVILASHETQNTEKEPTK